MDIRLFAEKVASIVANKLNTVEVEVKDVVKNNGIKYTGILIREYGSIVAPTIYVNDYYESAYSPEDAAAEVLKVYKEHKMPSIPDVNFFLEYEKVKSMLKAKLVNAENKQYAGISAKKYGYDDLKIVPYVNIDGLGTITILPDHLKKWNKRIQSVVSDALKNMKDDYTLKTMQSFIAQSMGLDSEEDLPDSPMKDVLIVSTKDQMLGAIAAITAKKELEKKYNGRYVVLPSSIHEVLVFEDNEELESMTEMVKAVNSQCIAPEERLSDKAYMIVT